MVFGLGDVGGVGGFDAVDSAGINDFAFLIDDEHMGCGFGFVLLADLAGGVDQDGGGGGIFIFGVGLGLGSSTVTLFARSGGDDGEPDHAFGGVLPLEFLHVTAGIVFLDERTFMVEPFEDDKFSAEVGEFVGGTLRIGQGEFWGDLARLNSGRGGESQA